MTKVSFNYADRKLPLNDKRILRNFIPEIFKREKKNLDILTYIFCSDEYLLSLNSEFLKHNTYTDILTFDLSDSVQIKGEIYISCDRVKENAQIHQTSLQDEFLRVIFHGALHLCGYKDKKPAEIAVMRNKEDFYINMFHVKHK